MSADYRIFGSEMSPYSVKVRSYFRYKGLPHRWLNRAGDTPGDYARHAKLPIIPLVITPDDEGVQDSTPIIDRIEAEHPGPVGASGDPTLAFLSALIEEFGDEWGNKWMFHYRWARDVDRASAGRPHRAFDEPAADEATWAAMTAQVRERMVSRVWFVGSSAENAGFIESTFQAAIAQLEAHLASRPYLFGARPAFGDFALWGQLYEAWTDPTPGALIEARAPAVLAWIHRMLYPAALGAFEDWASLAPTLAPILRDQVGRAVPALDGGQRRRLGGRSGGLHRSPRGRPRLDPEAAALSCEIAAGAARTLGRRRRPQRPRWDPAGNRVPGGPGRLSDRILPRWGRGTTRRVVEGARRWRGRPPAGPRSILKRARPATAPLHRASARSPSPNGGGSGAAAKLRGWSPQAALQRCHGERPGSDCADGTARGQGPVGKEEAAMAETDKGLSGVTRRVPSEIAAMVGFAIAIFGVVATGAAISSAIPPSASWMLTAAAYAGPAALAFGVYWAVARAPLGRDFFPLRFV